MTEATSLISGTYIKPLKRVVNDRGNLLEVQSSNDEIYPGFGQAYITTTNPGVIKAWYLHHRQTDQIALLKGTLLLVLYDTRQESSSFKQLQQIRMTEENPLLVQVPPGVWHGFRALGDKPAMLIHLNSIPFSLEHTDEERLSPDDPLIPFKWPAL